MFRKRSESESTEKKKRQTVSDSLVVPVTCLTLDMADPRGLEPLTFRSVGGGEITPSQELSVRKSEGNDKIEPKTAQNIAVEISKRFQWLANLCISACSAYVPQASAPEPSERAEKGGRMGQTKPKPDS